MSRTSLSHAGFSHPVVERALPGERVLWQGRPCWRALARDVLRIRLAALYVAAMVVWGMADDRAAGLGRLDTARAAVPGAVLGLLALGACALLAWAMARTTLYTVTTERCLIRFGLALTATVSVPWRRVGAVSVSVAGDGTGSIPLTLKPGPAPHAMKLWPHVRLALPLIRSLARPLARRPEPMLRCVPDAARVGTVVAQAARDAQPARNPGRVVPLPQPGLPAPGLLTAAGG